MDKKEKVINMSGPALSQLHAHRAIHDGALSGAVTFTNQLIALVKEGNKIVAKKAAMQLLDYWETRVLSHADAEESGFYQEKAKQSTTFHDAVILLKRDHEMLRIIVKDVKELLQSNDVNEKVIQKFHALLTINEIHSREEERLLFNE